MAKRRKGSHAPPSVQVSYQLIRNTTSPDEVATGVKSFVANLPAYEILALGTDQNLRDYIPGYNPRKRTRVHDDIRNTIETEPQRFITRNSGFVVTCVDIEVDDNKKLIRLVNPSIINGAQSQGEIDAWIRREYGDEPDLEWDEPPFYVRAEIIVEPDTSQAVETAIARNTAQPVRDMSKAGRRGYLDELGASIIALRPDIKIQMSETDENAYDTRNILQYARLLMPPSVSQNDTPSERLRAYKNPAQCLTDFTEWHESKHTDPAARTKYDFTVQIAPHAITEFEYWQRHPAWTGQRVFEVTKKGGRACRRHDGQIVWVSPGLVLPVVGAMSEFIEETAPGRWDLIKPDVFEPQEMIINAVAQFRSLDSDPMQMGRSAGAYDALRIYPSTLVKVMRDVRAARS